MAYVDFFALPLPKGNEEEYRRAAELFASVMKEHGLLLYYEGLADDVPRGEVTDFYRSVAARDNETVVAAFAVWPDKATRDSAWAKGMEDPRMKDVESHKNVFDHKRMFWGGFKPILEYDARSSS